LLLSAAKAQLFKSNSGNIRSKDVHQSVLLFRNRSLVYQSSGKGLEKSIKIFHEKYPDKPIFASEFGKRSDEAKSEQSKTVEVKVNTTTTQILVIENRKGFCVYHSGL
jgi:hypothetical protein